MAVILAPSEGVVPRRWSHPRQRSCGRRPAGASGTGAAVAALVVDEVVEPADLALDLLEPVALQLEGVLVHADAGAGHGVLDELQALRHPGAPALQDPQPRLGVGLPEEREPEAEVLVLPRGGAGGGQHVLELLLALGRELVDDPGALAGQPVGGR